VTPNRLELWNVSAKNEQVLASLRRETRREEKKGRKGRATQTVERTAALPTGGRRVMRGWSKRKGRSPGLWSNLWSRAGRARPKLYLYTLFFQTLGVRHATWLGEIEVNPQKLKKTLEDKPVRKFCYVGTLCMRMPGRLCEI
jgi:hypothetical protein